MQVLQTVNLKNQAQLKMPSIKHVKQMKRRRNSEKSGKNYTTKKL
jgi:hypothetical protein